MSQRSALVVGATGIAGGNLAQHLVHKGWDVYGLARKPQPGPGIQPIAADLLDENSLKQAVSGLDVTDVFICAWLRQPTEKENVLVNGAMVEHLFEALEGAKKLKHAALVTGTKHYLGPFESYGKTMAETPFREDQPRLPGENFYYTQEDILFAAAKRMGFTWSVHRAHTVIGYALGNAMNMGVTLAVYATICRETGRPFVFPGSQEQWNFLTDICDARVLAKQMEWAATGIQHGKWRYLPLALALAAAGCLLRSGGCGTACGVGSAGKADERCCSAVDGGCNQVWTC
jgi:nucleoside-diphosphate-sugar epimerase